MLGDVVIPVLECVAVSMTVSALVLTADDQFLVICIVMSLAVFLQRICRYRSVVSILSILQDTS